MRSPIAVSLVFGVFGVLAACSTAEPTLRGGASAGPGGEAGGLDDAGGVGSGGGSAEGRLQPPAELRQDRPTRPARRRLPCDVDAVLANNCRQCHGATPAFGASVPLVTWNDLQATAGGAPLYQAVESRIHDDASPMPPTPYSRLSTADTATIDAWVTAGAPSSRAVCSTQADAGAAPVVDPLPCTPDTHIAPASPYAMADSGEEYVCYGFDVTVTTKRQVIAMAPKIDNSAILHHLLLFQSDTAVSSTPAACSAGGSTAWSLIGGWAPGGKNIILPPEAGFPEMGTTHWVMQIHYYNAKGLSNQTDSSGFDLCTTDQLRANDAAVMAPGSVNFTIPARGTLDLSCTYAFPTGSRRRSTSSPRRRTCTCSARPSRRASSPAAPGAPVSVVDQPNWDFQTQLAYPVSNVINPGDSIVRPPATGTTRATPRWASASTRPTRCASRFSPTTPRSRPHSGAG